MVRRRLGGAEHRHHRVALELVDHAAEVQHDLGHRGQVLADHGGHIARGEALRDRREPADVREQHAHHDLLRLDRRLRVRGQTVGQLLRHERRQGLARRGLFDDGGVQPLELVEHAGAGAVSGHPPEQAGHLRVDRLLRGPERCGDLRVAHALGHHVQQLALTIGGVVTPGQPFSDHRIDGAAAGVDLADRARELVALRDPVLQQVRQAAVPTAQQRQGVRLVVVGRQHHDAGVRVRRADRMRAVDPLQLERRRHLDVRHDHVRHVLGGGRQQRRRVDRDPHHLDVVVGVQQRPNTLAHEHVVLAKHDPDAHPWLPRAGWPACTIRA